MEESIWGKDYSSNDTPNDIAEEASPSKSVISFTDHSSYK